MAVTTTITAPDRNLLQIDEGKTLSLAGSGECDAIAYQLDGLSNTKSVATMTLTGKSSVTIGPFADNTRVLIVVNSGEVIAVESFPNAGGGSQELAFTQLNEAPSEILQNGELCGSRDGENLVFNPSVPRFGYSTEFNAGQASATLGITLNSAANYGILSASVDAVMKVPNRDDMIAAAPWLESDSRVVESGIAMSVEFVIVGQKTVTIATSEDSSVPVYNTSAMAPGTIGYFVVAAYKDTNGDIQFEWSENVRHEPLKAILGTPVEGATITIVNGMPTWTAP